MHRRVLAPYLMCSPIAKAKVKCLFPLGTRHHALRNFARSMIFILYFQFGFSPCLHPTDNPAMVPPFRTCDGLDVFACDDGSHAQAATPTGSALPFA